MAVEPSEHGEFICALRECLGLDPRWDIWLHGSSARIRIDNAKAATGRLVTYVHVFRGAATGYTGKVAQGFECSG